MEILVFAGTLCLIMLAIYLLGIRQEKMRKQYLRKQWKKQYSEPGSSDDQRQIMPSASRYFQMHQEEFQIDNITWNDLSMDRIYERMNTSLSSAGEEYLYYRLRTPHFDQEQLDSFEKKVVFYQEKEEERIRLKFIFNDLGRTGKISIYDYLDYLDTLGELKNTTHICGIMLIAAAFLLTAFNVGSGMLFLILAVCFQMAVYLKGKGKVEPYFISVSYVMRLMAASKKLVKNTDSVIEEETKELKSLIIKMAGLEKGRFFLAAGMKAGDNPLGILMDYVNMIFHLDLMAFNRLIGEVRRHNGDIDRMNTILGSLETVIMTGEFRIAYPQICTPQFLKAEETKGHVVAFTSLYHPLLQNPVSNSLTIQKGILVTGSNASGKSTFLKTLALNQLLAQTLNFCFAKTYRCQFFHLYSSMALSDDLEGGDSYYIAEIKAIQRMMNDITDIPVMCIVDEVLRGTNTAERIAAGAEILRFLSQRGNLCLAATHDLELTSLLEDEFENYYFEESIREGEVYFPYQIKAGRAVARNAIRLLEVMGYDKKITQRAGKLADAFFKDGLWPLKERKI